MMAVMRRTHGNGETDGREQRGIHTFLRRPWEKLPRGHVADLSAALRTAVGLLTAIVKQA